LSRVVADVDWDRQAHLKRGVITWAGPVRIRANQTEAQMALNLQLHGMRLLDWLYDRDTTDPSFHDINQFAAESDLSEDSAQLLIEDLENRGVIEQIATYGGNWDAKLTAQGVDFVQKIRVERSDSVRRSRELQQHMLCWLHNQEHRGTPPSDWNDFLASDDAIFYGDRFTLAELERQAEYLSAKTLITSLHIAEAADGTLKPSLTAAGQDCVMDFGGNVSEYTNRQRCGGTTNINMTSSTGNIVVASENVKQNIKTGIDTRKLLEFAGFVRQVLPTLGLGEDDQAELDADAAELHRAAEEVEPDRGRLQQLSDAVMSGLIKAAPSIVTATATAMGNDAIRAITGH
jgi:predicted transcriptional regulator